MVMIVVDDARKEELEVVLERAGVAGDELVVHLSSLRTRIEQGAIIASLDVECDQAGRQTIVVPFAVGSDASGGIRVLGSNGETRTHIRAGFRLPLEGYFIARPAQTPVVYRDRSSERPYVSVIDNTNTMHQLQVEGGSSSAFVAGRIWSGASAPKMGRQKSTYRSD